MRRILSFIVFILIINQLYSQTFKNNIYKLNRYNLKFDESTSNLDNIYFDFQKKYIKYNYIDSSLIYKAKKKIVSNRDFILINIMRGDYILNSTLNKDSLAFHKYTLALKKAIKLGDTILICETLKRVNDYFLTSEKDTASYKFYSNLYEKYAHSKDNIAKSFFYKLAYQLQKNHFSGKNKKTHSLKDKFYKGINLSKKAKNAFIKAEFYQLLGVAYDLIYKNLDSSLFYYNKAENIYLSKEKITSLNNKLFDININKAHVFNQKKDFKKSILFLKTADTIKIFKKEIKGKINIYSLLSDNYIRFNNSKKAYFYLQKKDSLNNLLSEKKRNIAINEISVKYQTEKKEKENLQLKQDNLVSESKRKQSASLFYGALTFLFLGSIIAFLTIKNLKRKRLLAEQQKELETQKNLTLLKEQEITSINAMVEGQEKERKRIAEDLHDNIGSVLATLKLHFENLKLNRKKKQFNQEELYLKTEHLIDETYLKVRSLAHAKNAGVLANQGLLSAVNIMAEKISSANKTKIEVVDFGLNKTLENSLEINVFRIIQELITNIIKHAEAKKATINISQFNKELNVIIEDNGKGFDINKTEPSKGMGLNSIKTRIEHLNGSLEIDSNLGKGTTIIITIPIK